MSPLFSCGALDLDVHDRFEDRWLHFFHRRAKRLATGGAKRMLVGVDVVIGTVDQLHLEIHQRIAGNRSRLRGFDDAFLDCRAKLLRHGAAEDLVLENKTAAARQRLENNFAIAKLPAAAGLFLVTALHFGALRNRFLVGNLGRMQQSLPRRNASSVSLPQSRREPVLNRKAETLSSARRGVK